MELMCFVCEKDMILGDAGVERYGLNVSPPNSYVEVLPNPQCDGICRWGIWEIIRYRRGLEGGVSTMVLLSS